jgi:hypothetical protein
MSPPPPPPGTTATVDRQPPAEARPGAPEPRGAKFGTHQVLWGLVGLIVGLATGILGITAKSTTPAAAAPRPAASASARPAAAARAAARKAAARKAAAARAAVPTGLVMTGDGVFRIGPDRRAGNVRAGTWRTSGAVGGATGSCYVALLHRAGATSVIESEIITGPGRITTTGRAGAIRTSGCRPWHWVSGS